MAWDKREVLGLLRMEIENVRRRGFGLYFRDSVLCINAGKSSELDDACEQCLLQQFVPAQYKGDKLPCSHIPLNEAGDTLDSLRQKGTRKERDAAVLAWMEAAAARLEKEVAAARLEKEVEKERAARAR